MINIEITTTWLYCFVLVFVNCIYILIIIIPRYHRRYCKIRNTQCFKAWKKSLRLKQPLVIINGICYSVEKQDQ